MTITDEMLMAYVDGELPEAQRMAVDSAVAADPALFERLEKHRRLRLRVSGAFAGVLGEPVPERLTAAASSPNVVSLAERRRTPMPAWAAVAATLVIGVAAGLSIPRGSSPIASDMTARGELAGALDKQLASAPDNSAIRVGLTFRSVDGYCRTFSGKAVAGLACRQDGAWKVRMAVAADADAAAGEYRTAASDTPAEILEAAQAIMVGAPLDAKAEQAARDKGWTP